MDTDLFADGASTALILTPKEKKRVKELERWVPHLVRLHGEGKDCQHPDEDRIVPDSEFDGYVSELTRLKPDSHVLKSAMSAAPIDPNARKMKHDPPMGSISKVNGKEDEKAAILDKWIQSVADEFGISNDEAEKKLVMSYKHDGLACSIEYKNGNLVKAGLRPREGVFGEDVTANIKFVHNVPTKLPKPLTCIVRGEVECLLSVFERVNGSTAVDGEEFANTRNYSAGSIRQFTNPAKTKARQIQFTAYAVMGLDKPPFKSETARAKWCEKNLGIKFVGFRKFSRDELESMENGVADLDYEVDGSVISLDNLEEQEQMGFHGSAANACPKGRIAYKFKDEVAHPVLADIVWETGRTGRVTPVCTFKGVSLAGTVVGRAAGYSLGFFVRNNIKVGTKLRIRKSGKIIPEVLGRMAGDAFIEKIDAADPSIPENLDLSKFDYPKGCPSCGDKTEVEPGQKHGMLDLKCNNRQCPAQNVKWFTNYLDKFGSKGVGKATVEHIVESGLVKKFTDLYELKVSDLKGIGFSARESLRIVADIHMIVDSHKIKDNRALAQHVVAAMQQKKKVTLAKFLSCLGIRGAARGTGSALAQHLRSWDKILNATLDELVSTPDVGEKTATSLFEYFDYHRDDLKALTAKYLDIEMPKQGKYTGKSFVFTGGQPEGKEFWKEAVEREGGVIKSSVSKKVDYVVIGADAGAKEDKARDLVTEGHEITLVENHSDLKKMFS